MRSKTTRPRIMANIAGFLVLVALGLLVYLPVLNAPYLYDDHRVIQMSRAILPDADKSAGAESSAVEEALRLWKQPRPLRQFSHVVDRKLFGDSSGPAHVVNVLLHALTAFLGYRLLLAVGLPRIAAGLAALVFLLLPIGVESVAIVTHRKEMLAAVFVLLGLGLAIRDSAKAWAGAVLCFALAVGGKETALAFPLLFLVVRAAIRFQGLHPGRAFDARTWKAFAWLFLVAALLGLAAVLQIHASMAAPGAVRLDLGEDRLGHLSSAAGWGRAVRIAIWAFARYLRMIPSPWGHSLNPAIPLEIQCLSIEFVAALLAAVGFLVATALAWRRRLAYCGPLLWIAASLAIVVFPPLLRSGATVAYADRYAYLASFGFAWLVACAVNDVLERTHPKVLLALVLPLLGLYGVGVQRSARHYSSETPLWTHVLKSNPDNFKAEYNLATAAWKDSRDRDRALAHFRRMSTINPGFVFGHCAYSEVLAETGSLRDAIAVLEGCMTLRPDAPQLRAQRGLFRLTEGDVDAAASDFAQAIRLGGDEPILFHNYGIAQERRAQWKHAATLYARASRFAAFRKDAERAKLLTGDPPASRHGRSPRRNLVVELPNPSTRRDAETSDSRRLANVLNDRAPQRNLAGHRFLHADLPPSRPGTSVSALDARLKRDAPVANCIVMIDIPPGAPAEATTARLREITRHVMICRLNKARPLLVLLDPPRSPADPKPVEADQDASTLYERIHVFSGESGVVLVDSRSARLLPDSGEKQSRRHTETSQRSSVDLSSISDRILDLLLAERMVLPLQNNRPY